MASQRPSFVRKNGEAPSFENTSCAFLRQSFHHSAGGRPWRGHLDDDLKTFSLVPRSIPGRMRIPSADQSSYHIALGIWFLLEFEDDVVTIIEWGHC